VKIRRGWLPAIVIALVVLGSGTASAAPKGGQSHKIGAALMALHSEHAQHAAQRSGFPFASSNPLARLADERVVIDAVADGDPLALKAALSSLGMRHLAVFGRVVSGELPIAAIPALAAIASLRFARPSYARRAAGSVTTQGDQAMSADVARAHFGVTGAGVQVGVLSDSFNCLGGAPNDIASDDLSPVTVVEEISSCAGAVDEGRALLQIVHDVAPGASLSFASTANGQAGFANNILALQANGARVIVDDTRYLHEPMFQDGIIAQAVDTVVGLGATFFSAAGNQARESYESVFRAGAIFKDGAFPSVPGAAHFFGGTAHNFAPSGPPDHMQRVTIPSGETLMIPFQWDSPFFSVSGGAGSPNDLDIYLFNAAGTMVVAGSIDANVGGDASEILFFTNTGPTADFNLMIVSFEGPLPGFIKYVQGGSGITIAEFNTASGTVFGHTNATGARAVGAAFFAETPLFGVSPPLLEPFSSAGPTPIFFDTAGNRLASPVIRTKPEIVAPDGGNTTFLGTDIGDADKFPNLFGTSAAAAHAAAVAALLLQQQPALSPAAIYSALESTAIDMGPPGFDFDTGFGLIQADAALQAVSSPNISLGLTLNRHVVSAGDVVQVDISAANAGTSALQDFYFVILVPPALSASVGCPAGDAVVFITDAFSVLVVRCAATAPPQSFPALFRNVAFPAALPMITVPHFWSLVWPGGIPPGSYTFAAFTTPPAAFADGSIGPTDISAFASDSFRTSP